MTLTKVDIQSLNVPFAQCAYNWLDKKFYFITEHGNLASINEALFNSNMDHETEAHLNAFIESHATNLSEDWNLEGFIVKRFDFADNFRKMLVYVDKDMCEPDGDEIQKILDEVEDPEVRHKMEREVSMFVTGRRECFHTMYTIDLDFHWNNKVMLEIEGFTRMSRVSANFDASYVIAIKQVDQKLEEKNKEQDEGYEYRQLQRFGLEKLEKGEGYVGDEEGGKLYLDRVQGSVTCLQLIAPRQGMKVDDMRVITGETSGKLKLYKLKSGGQTMQPEFETNLYDDRVRADKGQEFTADVKKGLIPVKMMLNHNRDLLLVLNSESEMLVYRVLDDGFNLLAYTTSDEDLTQWDLSYSGQKVLLGGFPLESLQQWDLAKLTKDFISEKYEFKDFEARNIDFYMKGDQDNIKQITDIKDSEIRLNAYTFGDFDKYLTRDKNRGEQRRLANKKRQTINKQGVDMMKVDDEYGEELAKEMESGVQFSGLGVTESQITQEAESKQSVNVSDSDDDELDDM